jgi:Ca2+-binding RTX toxin-like protein
VLTATNTLSDADGLGAITYLWQRGEEAVGTGERYTVTDKDIGQHLQIVARYTDEAGHAERLASALTQTVQGVPVYRLSADRTTVAEGKTLDVKLTTQYLPPHTAVAYTVGGTVTASDLVGNSLANSAFVTGQDGTDVLRLSFAADALTEGTETLMLSLNDAPDQTLKLTLLDTSLSPVNHPATGTVTIKGDAVVGQTLNISQNLADADGLGVITYTWLANDKVLRTGARYTLTTAETGQTLRVVAQFTDGAGFQERISSAPSSRVQSATTNPSKAATLGNDVWAGTPLGDRFNALSGDDTLNGLGGNDTLIGGPGDDELNGGAGVDVMIGGEGADTYQVDNARDNVIEAAKSDDWDTVEARINYSLPEGVEILQLMGTALDAWGNALDNRIIGTNQDNSLVGYAGNDTLEGMDGNDTLEGGLGDDDLIGGSGDDVAVYSEGNKADYKISQDRESGQWTVESIYVSGSDKDILTGIEILRFADVDVTLVGLVGTVV